MALEQKFLCPLPNGVHARPASALEEVVRAFDSEITLVNQRTKRAANGKSVLAIVGADIRHKDPCLLKVSGSDELEAMAALKEFLHEKFPLCDQPLAASAQAGGQSQLPPCLRDAGAVIHRGLPVSPGIAHGRLVQMGKYAPPRAPRSKSAIAPETEWRKLGAALDDLVCQCDQRLARAGSEVEAQMIKVQRSIARDVEFRHRLQEEVRKHSRPADIAIARVQKHFCGVLASSGSDLLRDRALDIQDVCMALLRGIHGAVAADAKTELVAECIVTAESLTPGQFLALDRKFLRGLVLTLASATSHTVILARSFGIPTLAGVEGLATLNGHGQEAVVDADAGALVTRLTSQARRYYAMERQRLDDRQARLRRLAALPAATRDGSRIEVAANIGAPPEAAAAFASGAEAIGLFRTEMLFLDRAAPPDENEQLAAYREVLTAASGRPVSIRTLDVGGDKKLEYLKLAAEENPFLGRRGVRIYPEYEALFRIQIRALIRASAFGKLRLLIPMIATVEEARWVRTILADEQSKCADQAIQFDKAMPVGAMIEVPSAALALEALCREFDFFSVGSNDLLQYCMAADRANSRLDALYDPLQPAFLLLLRQIAAVARVHRKELSLCGEMGGQARLAPLLVGLGIEKLSAAAPAIAGIKTEIAGCLLADCIDLAGQALLCATAGDVSACLRQFGLRYHPPLLEPGAIIVDSDAATKEEAIKQATDRLFVLGRAEEARQVEEAVWRRELTYSTGFGHGFAVPHCKSAGVRFNSLVLLKPRVPLAWNSLDGQPVSVVILLALREDQGGATHLKVLAKLARKVMSKSFRSRLEAENDSSALCAILLEALEQQTS